MSNESGFGALKGGFTPAGKPGKLTVEQFREVTEIVKNLLADKPAIKWSIIAAGVGGFLDSLHMLWLFVGFLYRSLK